MKIDWNNMPEDLLQKIDKVKASLKRDSKKKILQIKENCMTALENDPLLSGTFCWNDMTDRPDIVKDPGWYRGEGTGITDTDLSYLYCYLERFYDLTSEKNIQRALDVIVSEHHYHPIREYLNSLAWDGQERVRYALRHFLGADTGDLTCESLKLFMLGAIERIFHPGCKFEMMLCLVGDQGAGKSTFFRFLALQNEWFSDDLKKMDDEKVYQKMQGHWIIEMAEMLGTASAKSVEEIKAFLSRQKETYRTPYDRYSKDHPRQCVFVGTSNKQRFLPLDRSGNRRFFPIQVNSEQAEVHILADETASREYIKQMWAEMMTVYRSGSWSLTLPPELEHQMSLHRLDFMAEDTTTGQIQAWLDEYEEDYVCTYIIYNKALGMPGEPDRKSINEINEIMNNTVEGWLPGPSTHRFGGIYGTQRAWHRSDRVNEPVPADMEIVPPFEEYVQEELPF